MATQLLVGLDIGGTKSATLIGDADGHVHARQEFPTTSPEETVGRLIELAKDLCTDECPAACGIACGGPLSSREGLILSPPNLPGWDRVPVVQMVRDALGIPAGLENDANAAAFAEWHWGFDRSVENLVFLTCGTGMGAGMVLGGRLYRGREDMAGEIGHVRLMPLGPVGYFKAGSVEGLTSGTALGSIARLRLAEPHAASVLDKFPLTGITGRSVGEAAVDGDEFAMAVVRELGDYLGRACAILIDVLNPQRISLGSLALRLGPLLVNAVRESARREALPIAMAACSIDKAVLGDRIQDLATLAVAREAMEQK